METHPPFPQHLPQRQSGGALAKLAAGLGLLLLLLAVALFVGLRTEWGTRAVWNAAGRLLPGELSGELSGGTLAEGIRLRNLVYRDATTLLKIDSLEGDWRLSFSPLTLTIDSLKVGRVDLTTQPTPEEPTQGPPRITLPLAIELSDATVSQVVLHEDAAETRYSDIRLAASSDGVRHTVNLRHAGTPFGELASQLRLAGEAPFPVDGNIELDGRYDEQAFRLNARLSGTLQALHIEANGSGPGFSAKAGIDATPYAPVPLQRAEVSIDGFDPSAINPEWPQAELRLRASLTPTGPADNLSQLVVTGPVELSNARPGPIDKQLLPLESARMAVTLDAQRQQLTQVRILLNGDGMLEGAGELRKDGSGEFTLDAHQLDLKALHTAMRPTRLAGPLSLQLADGRQMLKLELKGSQPKGPQLLLRADAEATPEAMVLHSAELEAGEAGLDLRGRMARDTEGAFVASGRLQEFNPALFMEQMNGAGRSGAKRGEQPGFSVPQADINLVFDAQGKLRPELTAQVSFDIDDSSYAGLPMSGEGMLRIAGKRILPSEAELTIAGNHASLNGSFGSPRDRLKFSIDAPALDRLGFGLSGSLELDGEASGQLERPAVNARFRGEKLAFGAHRLASLSGEASMQGLPGNAPNGLIDFDLSARDLESGEIRLASLNADVDGSYANHTVRLDADGRLRGQPLDLGVGAQGRLRETGQGLAWDGSLRKLENRTAPRIELTAPLALSIAPGRIEAGAGSLSLAQARIELDGLRYDQGGLRSKGAISALDVGRVLTLVQQFTGIAPPVASSLVLDGSWDLTVADTASGYLRIERRSGDIGIPSPVGERMLGLNALSLNADLKGRTVDMTVRAAAERIGSLQGEGRVQLQPVDGRLALAPDAPVSARIEASIPRLQSIASLAGPRIALDGSASLALSVAGTLSDPRLSGILNGDGLALTLYDQGVRLRDGTARVVLDDNVIELREVLFHGGQGTLRATGSIPIDGRDGALSARIVADKLQLLASPSGQMTISGQATAANVDEQMLVTGKFTVDRALFSLPEKSAPKLDDDVVVIRDGDQAQTRKPAAEQPASPFTPRVDVTVDLGRNFRFEGSGAELRLAGTINIESAPNQPPQAFGTVRVVEGSYEAFGTELAIERGVINFQGSLSNPNLNILAMRREQEVAAGVQITGTVQQPRVTLVSEPNVSDEEKLSWLIFGRGGGGTEPGQAQAAAQGAALGLLNKFGGSRIAQGLGLDELSIGASEFGLEGSQVVNLGKAITDRLFIGYEQSLAGAESVLKLTYELSRSWTVVMRGGAVTGLDLFYNKRFDNFGRR